MIPVHQCEDFSDTTPLFPVKGLYFKPISRIHVSVHYPQLKQSLPTGGKTVSSWDIMEKLKALLAPDKFISIRVVKNTLEFIRFEGDLENRNVMKAIMGRLEGKSIKVTGFKEPMKVRVAEAKVPFPSKYDWDSFFRDAKNMNEMKAGERPDTIHLQNLPCKWFSDRPSEDKPIPSEKLFRRIWETFGDVRAIDIPLADPYRTQMQSSIAGIKTFTFSNDAVFEAYIQYRDYMSFVRAMDAMRGSYILFQENNKHWVANVKVDFDKSKHLGEESIRKRRIERERLMEKEKQEKITATLSKLEEKEKARKDVEEKKRETDKNQAKLDYKIAMEERKYIIARRKLEAIRLMDYLFERLKKKLKDSKRLKHKDKDMGSDLHEKIMGKYKRLQQAKVEEQHKKLKKFHKSKKRDSNHLESGDDMENRDDRYRSVSRSRSRSRSRSESRVGSHTGSRYSNRSRSRSLSESRRRSRSRSRTRSRGGSRSRSREREGSRSRERSRSRSGSRDRVRDEYRQRDHYNHNNQYQNRGDSYYRGGPGQRNYDKRDANYERGFERDGRRNDHHYENDHRYQGRNEFENHHHQGREGDFPHPSRPPRGNFHRGRGDAPPYRGRGRGHFPSRYLGDWEIRDREHPHGPGPGPMPPHPGPPPYDSPQEFYRGRGRGRGNFRGRGRGFHNNSHPHPYQNNQYDKYQRYNNNNGPEVHRDFTYLEELDRAYEKYFKSITTKNDRSADEAGSPDH